MRSVPPASALGSGVTTTARRLTRRLYDRNRRAPPPVATMRPVRRRWAVLTLLLAAALVACGGSDSASGNNGGKFACFDFVAMVTSGPNAGRSWSGDLILNADKTGAFTGLLVPAGAADRQTITVKDSSGAICRAVGQRNGAQVTWFLYCGSDRIFGTGQVVPTAASQAGGPQTNQELRGIIQGPTDRDFGVYHGRNYPPYIRIISPSFS